jgi:hypothetical protein
LLEDPKNRLQTSRRWFNLGLQVEKIMSLENRIAQAANKYREDIKSLLNEEVLRAAQAIPNKKPKAEKTGSMSMPPVTKANPQALDMSETPDANEVAHYMTKYRVKDRKHMKYILTAQGAVFKTHNRYVLVYWPKKGASR